MKIKLSNEITVECPTSDLLTACKNNLIIDNPDYQTKLKLGKWLGKTPPKLNLFRCSGQKLILPYGTLDMLKEYVKEGDIVEKDFTTQKVNYSSDIPLYDYQKEAVNAMSAQKCGILKAPAGSGKTQMGIALICKLGLKALWLTHTGDLLLQSKSRAERYIDKKLIGTITGGKVSIGEGITFATVQTMTKLYLPKYKYEFDVIVVDECHRVAGSELKRTQFSTVLSSLAAKYKYGLTATVHRADGMERSIFAQIGNVKYTVPESAVSDRVMKVTVKKLLTGCDFPPDCTSFDGTLIYSKYITQLSYDSSRNAFIAEMLKENSEHYNLILSDRLQQLSNIYEILPDSLKKDCVLINGSTKKEIREQKLEDVRQGRKHYIFASYKLAKEGLDIPRLDRLYLATPQKDEAIVIQSVGRIARTFGGKEKPVCYDFVDNFRFSENFYKKRCTSYKKCGCIIEKEV